MAEDAVRCWLVERDYWDEDVVTLVYATPDGERHHTRQLSGALLSKVDVTAAMAVAPADLQPTPAEDVERYATEARRVRAERDPDEPV